MKVIPVNTDSGQIVYVEFSDDVNIVSGAVGGGSIADAEATVGMIRRIEEVGTTIADVCRSIQQKVLASMGDSRPEELTLEFGVVLAGETGIPLITKGSVEGTFNVTAKWNLSKSKG